MNIKEQFEKVNIQNHFRFEVKVELTEDTVKVISMKNEELTNLLLSDLTTNGFTLKSIEIEHKYEDEEWGVFPVTLWEFAPMKTLIQ